MFSFRPCSQEEALAVLRDPSVMSNLKGYPVAWPGFDTYLVDEAILVGLKSQGEAVEIHVGIPYRHRAFLRSDAHLVLGMLKGAGFKRVFTTVLGERNALTNMLQKLGFQFSSDRWVKTWEWTR